MEKTVAKGTDKSTNGKRRNYDLGSGIHRFSKSKMFHKKAIYKFLGKKVAPTKKEFKAKSVVEKPIGGEKNGSKRLVRKTSHRC